MKTKFPWFKPLINKKKFRSSILNIIDNNKMTMGIKTIQLENYLSKTLNVKHVILTTSGTSALLMGTLALDIRKKDKIISPNLTWVASINPIRIIGSKIILVDCKNKSELVDYKKLNLKIKKHRPKLVILVHLNGQVIYNKEFDHLKKKYKFKVIEDAAQSLFVKYGNRYSGTKYDIGCFSLSITKPINMIYGGFCVTNSRRLAEKMKAIRNNGVNSLPENAMLELPTNKGLNLKPSDMHTTMGLQNLQIRKKIFDKTKDMHKLYQNRIKNPKLNFVKINYKNSLPCYAQIFVKNRKKFFNYCKNNGIELHFGIRSLDNVIKTSKNDLKNSIFISENLLRLPFGAGYSLKEINKVINIINKY